MFCSSASAAEILKQNGFDLLSRPASFPKQPLRCRMSGVVPAVLSAASKCHTYIGCLLLRLHQISKIYDLLIMCFFFCSALFRCLKILHGVSPCSLILSLPLKYLKKSKQQLMFSSAALGDQRFGSKDSCPAASALLCSALSNDISRPTVFCLSRLCRLNISNRTNTDLCCSLEPRKTKKLQRVCYV